MPILLPPAPCSHDDFKPQVKSGAAAGSVEATIESDISSHDVFIYMKAGLLLSVGWLWLLVAIH